MVMALTLVGVNWALVGSDDTNIGGHQTGICRLQRRWCWWASTMLELTWVVAAEVGRGEGGMEDGGEDKHWTLSLCWLLSIMACVCHIWFTSKINWKSMLASNILDFEMGIFGPETYHILRLKNWLRPLRPVFAWSLIFENGDGPKTGLRLWSWSVLWISGLDRSWSSPVLVFFHSWDWTFKH